MHIALFIVSTIVLLVLFSNHTTSSTAGHGQSLVSAWVEILEPTALSSQRIPLQLAQFSIVPPQSIGLTAFLSLMDPINGCTDKTGAITSTPATLKTTPAPIFSQYTDTIVLVERGDCQFIEKANVVEQLGASGFLLSNSIDTMIPVPIASADGQPPPRYLPIVGGAILGRDGNFLKALLQRGVPVRVRIIADGDIKPL